MNHPGISTILATGGNAMVKAAYSCGKPALGVGAGNVPCYIHSSCDQDETVNDVVLSKSFDNGMICASESAVFIDASIYDAMKAKFAHFRTYFANEKEKHLLEKFMFGVESGKPGVENGKLNADIAGMSASWIAEKAGFKVPEGTSVIGVELKKVGPEEPLSREKLCPVLGFYKVKDARRLCLKRGDAGIRWLGPQRGDPLQRASAGRCLWRHRQSAPHHLEFAVDLRRNRQCL
jgi:acetaldehyde dehydrogenase/alcohol dehydrogenase